MKAHSLKSFRYNGDLFKDDVSSRKNNLEEKILSSARHSQKSEYEADNVGWDLYINAGFPANEALNALDRLLYAYLPASHFDM